MAKGRTINGFRVPVVSALPGSADRGLFLLVTDGRAYLATETNVLSEIPLAVTSGSSARQVLRINGSNNGFELVTLSEKKAITIESPTSSEDITLFYTDEAITITKMAAVAVGSSPSVTWTVRHHSDRSNTGNEVVTGGTTTTSTSTGSVVTSFNDATIPADSWVWIETTAMSGTVGNLSITIKYVKD